MTVLPSALQQFIHKSRYARYLDSEQRRETWDETVTRYIDFATEHIGEKHPKGLDAWNGIKNEVKEAILNLKIMPSMRLLMTAGEAVKRDNISAYNCFYTAIDKKRKFSDILHILLNGTGAGFSCERQDIAKLPQIANNIEVSEDVIVVQDSKKGWSTAYKKLITALYAGEIPKFDFSKIRPAGQRLKVFGGRASGPEPLKDLFEFTINVFKHAAGRKLNSIEVHDICCKIADVVVVGGVRRSALISLSNLSDRRMREAKSGAWWEDNPQRRLANNSAVYTEKPDMETFMEEWLSLVKSKSGERGIFSRVAAQKQASRWGRRDPDAAYGCNPCCFTGDMKLLTADGYKKFSELSGKDVGIINKNGQVTNGSVWSSGVKPVVELRFQNKNSIICTEDHIFMDNLGFEVMAKDMEKRRIMPYVDIKTSFDREDFFAGFIQGDGCTGRLDSTAHKGLEVNIGANDVDVAEFLGIRTGKTYSKEALEIASNWGLSSAVLPERKLPTKITASFLSGLFSANGSIIKNQRIALKTTCRELADQLVVELEKFAIYAYITTNKAKSVDFDNGTYVCKESYDVNIARYSSQINFAKHISFVHKYKQDSLRNMLVNRAPYVRKVKRVGNREVFDFTEPETHWGVVEGCIVHNSEILLLPTGEFCNLTELVVRAEDNYESLKNKVRLCTILGTFQSTLTDFDFIEPVIKENCEKERLLGVSMTGVMDHKILNTVSDTSKEWLVKLRDYAREINAEWAGKFEINCSAAITCNKPSGTVGQLTNVGTGGLHPRFSQYYLRTIRQDNKDPVTAFLKAQGIYNEPDNMNPRNTTVFYFPVKGPKDAVFRDDRTAIEQLEHWLMFQRDWCEHKPSITIYVKEHEWMAVGDWVYKNFDEVSGVSFLPFSDHTYKQAPFMPISEKEFLEWDLKTPNIDWESFVELDDQTVSSQELACSSGSCSI